MSKEIAIINNNQQTGSIMNRLKYRAFDEVSGNLIYLESFVTHTNGITIIFDNDNNHHITDDEFWEERAGWGEIDFLNEEQKLVTMEQCNGFEDANNKLIYAGDLMVSHNSTVCLVEYKGSGFCLSPINAAPSFTPENWSKYTVIGNIHETPNLLENAA